MRTLIVAGLLGLVSISAVHAQMTDDQRRAEVDKLNWQRGGIQKLTSSHSTLSVPGDHAVLVGADAVRFEQIIGNHNIGDIEAVTVDQADEQVIFQSIQEGHVSLDDWNDIDAKAMLEGHDSYTFFERIGDLLVTGPTLTNVNALRAVAIAA